MFDNADQQHWRIKTIHAGMSGISQWVNKVGLPDGGFFSFFIRPIRPADISINLTDVMLDRNNMIEDVNYQKVVSNRFTIEVSRANFSRLYQPIQEQIIQQMRSKLLEDLVTANKRRGRKEFRFGGRLRLDIRPAADLKDDEARILYRIEQEPELHSSSGKQTKKSAPFAAFLEFIPTGQRWALFPGINTIGRNEICQIYIDHPVVQEKRLVSGNHAYILMERNTCTLYDGSPGGRPSANGTYVNFIRVQPVGCILHNKDEILLAAMDPIHPRKDTPGVASFHFWNEPKDR